MADKAHRLTDEKLEEMEKRLSAIYSRAEKEITKTADEYFSKFAKQDEAKRKLLEQGKITEDEYKKWRKGRVMYGKRFTEMKEQCAKQLLNVNQTALAYVNGELPEVYALNYNAIAGSVDGVGGYSFTLVDADTVRNLAVTDTSLLPYKELDPAKDIPWNMKKINAETLQGILQGESMDKIAKRLRNVQEMNKTQAIRSARTIVTGAENKGRQDSYARAEADGIILQKEWLATNDGRTRHSHAMLDGAIVDQDKKFENGLMYPGDPSGRPEEVYNCFVGETKVASDSDVVRSYKHKYNGEIISIKTAGGVQFSCTPNHPILTPNGWIAAELLNNGDNILVTFGEQNVFGGVNPDIKHRFPRIDAIHKFGKKMGGQRACGLSVNFHGDVATSNVEIVTQERLLGNVRYSSGRNGIDKFLLKLSNKTLSSLGSLFEHFWSVCKTSFGFIGCKCKSLSFFKCGVSHSCEHGFGTIANRDGVLTEYSINDLPADTVIDGELLDRLSCKVFLDTIVNVDVSVLSTHVYNLQTENGYYFVNSIVPQDAKKSNGIFAIAKNCRCTIVAKVNGFKKVQVQKAMAEKQVEEPQKTAFTPAKTTEEAQQYAERFVDKYKSSLTGQVDYGGIQLSYANEMNRAFTEVFNAYDTQYPLRNIKPFNTREKRFKGTTAEAAYQWGLNDMFYNKAYYKTAKAFNDHLAEYNKLLQTVLPNIDTAIARTKPGASLRYLEALKRTGRTNVFAPDAYGSTIHEMGHYLDDQIFRKAFKEKGFDLSASFEKYSGGISGYATATQQEYIAESFVAYWKGETDIIDPDLLKIFEGAKKK